MQDDDRESGLGYPLDRVTFEWKVMDLILDIRERETFRSSAAVCFCDRTWNLRLYLHMPELIVCLYMAGEYPGPPLKVRYSFGLRMEGGVEWRVQGIGYFGPNTGKGWKRGLFLTKSQLRQRWLDFAPNGFLTIICTLKKDDGCCLRGPSFERSSDGLRSVANPTQSLCLSQKFCDVTFYVKGELIMAHKSILRANSPVLAAELAPGSKSEHAAHYEPTVFKLFLSYLYTKRTGKMGFDAAFELYELAAAYRVPRLQKKCASVMKARMTPDVVCDIILFAEKHLDKQLLDVALKYQMSHATEVIESSGWLRFVRKKPVEANKLYLSISERFTR